jgi:hypothetical protein
LQHLLAGLYAVECLYGLAGSTADQCLDIHLYFFAILVQRYEKVSKKPKENLFSLKRCQDTVAICGSDAVTIRVKNKKSCYPASLGVKVLVVSWLPH